MPQGIRKDGEHWCTGALLNQRLIITTANCVWKSNRMSRLKIRAGSRHVQQGGQVAEIAEVMKHPKWSIRKNPDNDVALLLTDRNIKFSHSCHAVDLPNRVMMPVFDDAWIVSWGTERRDGIYDRQEMTLQVFHSRLMNRDKCNNITMRFGVFVSDNFICLEQTGRRAPCTRDTGAPAVSDGVLWGLASWGIRKMCGTERFPAMFSYIASDSNMDFIINATHFMMAEERLYPFLDRYQAQSDILRPVRH
ncbi:trypsin delta-like [Pectinophora gossypiella]|uniref:trypsin delta-like n=1 Tax=Pectinophora gossypiella TaxID=13191 RepID=UPI00214E3A16|nr:trypsin delta-like [Pectinophora gossypiella]